MEFDEIESLFARLLAVARTVLSESDCAEVQHFIDVGEYGIALETAVGAYVEAKKTASRETQDLIQRLALAMEMDAEGLLGHLRNEAGESSPGA